MNNRAEMNFIFRTIKSTFSAYPAIPTPDQELKQLDWKELYRLANFHRIRPLLTDELTRNKSIKYPNSQPFFNFYTYQTLKNLALIVESARLLSVFDQHSIPVLPYKGTLFIREFYPKKNIRELDDIDFLFKPESVSEAIKLLQADGYSLSVRDGPISDAEENARILRMLADKGKYELSMKKDKFTIDVHWDLMYYFLPYQVEYDQFFLRASKKPFYSTICHVPDSETIFWMLILHHGGKEFWLRLKHLVDLMAFMNVYGAQMNWEALLLQAKKYKLYTAVMTGFYLVNTHFSAALPPAVYEALLMFKPPNSRRIERYWAYATHWLNVVPMLRYERICMTNQDEGFNKSRYMRQLIREHSKPNPVGRKAMVTIPERFLYTSFVYKLLSYLWRRLY
ncbi:nucleotidyltransferase domain-containing protein [Fibrella forsythiae]|uniref:Nucleotidyltransferase family protein n=1 Tax=Fibrella forsythiae TaxID=2817061 RepID=A0ABS3JH65_9BACT|nr:nucleotidyltransferase family protein [Fibrella forsythiae]MBO0949350.1 nucleotidyltransferase family protein [Fibrella forsythiae]